MKRCYLILLCALISLAARGGIYRHDIPVARYMALAVQPQFDCIGMVFVDHTDLHGTCVLIGNRFILSAAHVFIESDIRPDTTYLDGKRTILFNPVNSHIGATDKYSFSFAHRTYDAKSITIFPAYLDSTTKGQCDLALIELEDTVEANIRPAVITPTDAAVKDTLTGVGYGVSGPANDPGLVGNWMEKIAGQNIIDTIGGYNYQGHPMLLTTDFDDPADSSCCNKLGYAQALPLEYNTGGGDSGGGAFRHTANGWELIGILSGGGVNIRQMIKTGGYYGQLSEWTRIAPFREWIREQMKGSQ